MVCCLDEQVLLCIPGAAAHRMVSRYYALDEPVVKELLGKKLNGKTRKDLDDVSEATRTPLKSCRCASLSHYETHMVYMHSRYKPGF